MSNSLLIIAVLIFHLQIMRIHADLSEEDYVSSQKVMPIDADLSEEDYVSSQWLIQEPTDEDVSEEKGETGSAQKVQSVEAVLCSLGEPSEAKVLSQCQCSMMVQKQIQIMELSIQELQNSIKDIQAQLAPQFATEQ
ncbi:uncharacterized protein LOC107359399 [Tetranychus urticae]|uniref:uncharacterized protein LOC107359399 n=1 Tax=Tetranychus urticae TaxID=32264 RepID=UPI000D653522|nr:uncharacterized protein LOC107359399 [Tetranychus urticae]